MARVGFVRSARVILARFPYPRWSRRQRRTLPTLNHGAGSEVAPKRRPQKWHHTDLVVDRGDGLPVNPDIYTWYFHRMAKRIGCEEVTPHQLRHYYGTELNRRGVDVKTISVLTGHAREAFTLQVYAAYRPESADRALEAITAALG